MAQDSNVRFLRINGRIVPIKQKGPGEAPPYKQGSKAKNMPSTTLLITTNKNETNKNSLMSFGVGAVAGIGTYAFLRKFKLSKNPQLANLQQAVKDAGGLKTSFVKGYGAKNEKIASAIYGVKFAKKDGGVVFRHMHNAKFSGSHNINPDSLHALFSDKDMFGKIMAQSKGATPLTYNLDEALKRVGNEPKKLKELFPKKDYVIKPVDGALSSFDDFVKTADIEKGNYKQVIRESPEHIIQERMKINKEYRAHFLNGEVYAVSHRNIPNEKIRNLYNKISYKINKTKGGGAFVPIVGKKRKEIEEFTKLHMKNIGANDLPKDTSLHVAFDIADTPDGLKFVEANTSMGTFTNPIVNRKFNRLATGRWGRDVSAGAGVVTGAGVGGAAYNVSTNTKNKKR